MGAQAFIHEVTAKSAKEAFDLLIEQANREYGIESYNGSINTCNMGSCKKKFDKYSKSNEDKAYKLINELQNGAKWTADYIDLGIEKYESVTWKRVHKDGASKNYRMKYRVFKYNFKTMDYDIETEFYFDTKPEADKKAMVLSVKDDVKHAVKKIYVPLDNKNLIVAETECERKTYKTEPKLKPIPERKVYKYHKYIFFGWASC